MKYLISLLSVLFCFSSSVAYAGEYKYYHVSLFGPWALFIGIGILICVPILLLIILPLFIKKDTPEESDAAIDKK